MIRYNESVDIDEKQAHTRHMGDEIMEISPNEYPKDRAWDEKVFSMPNIPRGSEGLLQVLRDILGSVHIRRNVIK